MTTIALRKLRLSRALGQKENRLNVVWPEPHVGSTQTYVNREMLFSFSLDNDNKSSQ